MRSYNLKLGSLKETIVVRKMDYLILLSNVVLVKKDCGISQMCMAFIYVNNVFPKDCLPLTSIDQPVYTTIVFGQMSFLNAYSCYNHIRIHLEDKENTSFITKNNTKDQLTKYLKTSSKETWKHMWMIVQPTDHVKKSTEVFRGNLKLCDGFEP